MKTLTISHTRKDGTIVAGTSNKDGANIVLKDLRKGLYRWCFSFRGAYWFVPQSRGTSPDTEFIQLTALALEQAGFGVELQIDDSPLWSRSVKTERVPFVAESADPEPEPEPVKPAKATAHPSPLDMPARIATRDGHLKVRLNPDGVVEVDLSGDLDSRIAAAFIRELQGQNRANGDNTTDTHTRDISYENVPKGSVEPDDPDLSDIDLDTWRFLRQQDNTSGVTVLQLSRTRDISLTAAQHRMTRLHDKGYSKRIAWGRYRATTDLIAGVEDIPRGRPPSGATRAELLQYIIDHDVTGGVEVADMRRDLDMTDPALYTQLGRLTRDNALIRIDRGRYRAVNAPRIRHP